MSKIHTTRRLSDKTQPMAFLQSPWSKSMLSVATVSGVMFLVGAIAPVFSIAQPTPTLDSNWQIAQTFRPPNRGAPRSTDGAGTRGGPNCLLDNQKKLTPLAPELSGRSLGLTVSTHPTFFGYIPASAATSGEFILKDRTTGQPVYRTSFTVPNQPGIVSISLPSTVKPLEIGKMYNWQLGLVCSSGIMYSRTAWIERIQPSQTLANQLKNATPNNLPALYANEGIWHEAVASRAKLRASQPKALWDRNWQQLLRTAGLQDFIREPLVDCCQATSS
jgi:Domain of Unknown Function (DUF928)